MKKFIKILVLFSISLSTNLLAWEVTTHETITKIAVTGSDRVENLNHFIDTFDLRDEDYSTEGNTEFYWAEGLLGKKLSSSSYIGMIEEINKNYYDNEIDSNIQEGRYTHLIQAGAILEDAQMGIPITSARFNRHFYDPSKNGCDGLGNAECVKSWALDGGSANDSNDFSWKSIVGTTTQKGYLLESIIGDTNASRKTAQASLFVSLGFLSHFMGDLTQPSHVRDDMHAGDGKPGGKSEIEVWANENFKARVKEAISYDLALNALTFNPTSFDALFTETATWTNRNFFSDDTTPGDVFDSHASPKDSTQQVEILTQWWGHDYYFLTASGLDISDGAKILYHINRFGPDVVHLGTDSYTLVHAVPGLAEEKKYTVVENNAKFVFPKAVSAIEGMINYIFRAKIYAYVDPNDSDKLIVKNVTNQNEIAQGLDTAFRDGTKIYIYYETKNGERKPFPNIGETELSTHNKTQLANDDTITIAGLSSAISQVEPDMNDDKTIIVALAGQMGGDGIGERAIAVFILKIKQFSFTLNYDFKYTLTPTNNSGIKYHRSIVYTYITPDTNCTFVSGGSANNGYGFIDRGDDFYLNQGLSYQRENWELWNIQTTNRNVKCIINSHGYEVSETEPMMLRGKETRVVKESSDTKKHYLLEQEYIIKIKN